MFSRMRAQAHLVAGDEHDGHVGAVHGKAWGSGTGYSHWLVWVKADMK